MQVSGYQLKKFLKFLDITQDEASKRLNVSRQTINTWCKLAALDDTALNNVKTTFTEFSSWLLNGEGDPIMSQSGETRQILEDPQTKFYEPLDPVAQLIRNNTILAESNARMTETHKILIESNAAMVDSMKKMTDQIIKLCSNESPSGLTETIEAVKREITETIRGELKNNHAREDVGCADAG